MSAFKRISDLPLKAEPSPEDIVILVDTGVTPISTKKTTLAGILAAFRNVPSGLAILDENGKIPTTQLPPLAINNTFVVNSESALLSLVAEIGDVAVRTDLNKSFILAAEPSSIVNNWVELVTAGISPTNQLDGGSF
jgi:hypothetical protein